MMPLFDITPKKKEFDYSKRYDIVLCAVGVEHFMEELPFNVLLIASYLRDKGFKTACYVISGEYENKREAALKKLTKCCDYIGITTNDDHYPTIVRSINYLTGYGFPPEKIIVGGILVNYQYPYLKDHLEEYDELNFIAGEGCQKIHEFLTGKKQPPADIYNVRCDRSLMYKDEYNEYYIDQNTLSFGCAHNACSMCHSIVPGMDQHIHRNFEMVIDENEELAMMGSSRIHNICACAYIDEFAPFYRLWNRNKYLRNVQHRGSAILDMMTDEIYELIDPLSYSIEYGIEHGSDKMLSIFNKSHDRKEISDHLRIISKYGNMLYRFYFIVGHPAETIEDVVESIELVKEMTQVLENTRFKAIAFQYFPHTHLHSDLKEYYHIDSYDLLHYPFQKGFDGLTQGHRDMIKEFYRYCDNHNYPQGKAIRNRSEWLEDIN